VKAQSLTANKQVWLWELNGNSYSILNTEVHDLTAIYDCVVGQMLRNSICETNGKFRQWKLLNVEGTSTSRTGRIENSQTKYKSLERVIFLLCIIV